MNVQNLFRPAALPPEAPFNPAQRAWLEGFIAGLMTPQAGGPAQAAATAPAKAPVTVVFASQTGTAERLAKKLAKAAKAKGHPARAIDIEEIDLDALKGMGHLAMIASTTGEGEAPDGAKALARALDAAEGRPLDGLGYAVLALGDSNYEQFCAFGRRIDERLGALGAEAVIERVEVDGDPDAPFEAFRDALLAALAEKGAGAVPAEPAAAAEDDEDEERWTRANPFPARLIANERLNEGSDKETRHVALSLEGSGLAYEPGDALGTIATNDPGLVARVIEAAGLDGTAMVTFGRDAPAPLAQVLERHAVITELSPAVLLRFQERARDPALARLLADGASEALDAWLHGRDLLDLLSAYPGVVGDAQTLAGLLATLQPRLYSIASSLRAHPGEVHLTMATVRYDAHGRARGGVASTQFADRLGPGDTIGVYLTRNKRFRLPEDGAVPVIMIGPGTGVAPFRAFLEERRAVGAKGPAWLFFGERRVATDFLYRRELMGYLRDGTLARLDTAFSRDGAGKVYVQDRIREHGAEVWRWIGEGAHLYVCGDAKRMARDVDRALAVVIAEHGRMSEAEAELRLDALMAERRYLKDVY
ncbi:MAG: sulfite reductase flavoprotein subunit alpha [Paracoccaceae bacterium]